MAISSPEAPPAAPTRPDTVVHCSDLHFGSGFRSNLAEDLVAHINEVHPDLVVISGDLTMRARAEQFKSARALLQKINAPLLIIPGNHDVPLFAFWHRALRPFANYRRFIADLSTSPVSLNHVAFFGMNTINPWKHQQGKFRGMELQELERWTQQLPEHLWRIAVVHQHFANIPGHERPGVFPRGEKILRRMSDTGIHAILHGHVHYHHVASSAEFFPTISPPLVLVCAGTPTSLRTRGATPTNNYNVLRFSPDTYEVNQCNWSPDGKGFGFCGFVTFNRSFYSPAVS